MDAYSRGAGASGSKKPRIRDSVSGKPEATCDQCWQHEMQCKFNPADQDSCPSCTSRNIRCTWTRSAKPRPPPDNSYVEYLEGRVKEMEKRLKQMFPGINPKREIESLLGPEPPAGTPPHPVPSPSSSQPSSLSPAPARSSAPVTIPDTIVQRARLANLGSRLGSSDSHDDNTIWATSASTNKDEPRYHGQSSVEILSRDAEIFRASFGINDSLPDPSQTHRRPEFWRPTAAEQRLLNTSPWETEEGLSLELPPDDLIPVIFDAFFQHVNSLFPIVHRPLIEQKMREGLHRRNGTFLRLIVLICANGAQVCDDPRVLDDKWPTPLSAGWKWFRQVQPWHKTFCEQASLWDVQVMSLMTLFLTTTSAHHGSWMVIGNVIRILQDIGCHRKKAVVSLENEIYKRNFWSMLFCDRFLSTVLGRHGAMQDLDSDLDDVLEVDDEYWSLEPNAPPPVQPEGLPSRHVMFNQLISLCRIMGRSLQTVFALENTKRKIGLDGPRGEHWMMHDMNTQLGVWARSVPLHLRLPSPDNYTPSPSLCRAVSLWSTYYYVVITINQPFISKPSPLALSSLRICREAARACASMSDAYARVSNSVCTPNRFQAAFVSAMVLLVDLIAQGKVEQLAMERGEPDVDITASGEYSVEQKEEDVRRCMRALECGEKRFHIAGRLHDITREFEQSWRLELSPSARSSRSGKSSSPGVELGQRPPRSHLDPPLFHPSESMPNPMTTTPPRIKTEVDLEAFDISYSPPPMPEDFGSALQSEPHPSTTETPNYGFVYSSNAASDALPGPHPIAPLIHLPPTTPFKGMPYPAPPRAKSWSEPEERSWHNTPFSELRPYVPGYAYPTSSMPQQPQGHNAPSLLPGLPSTNSPSDNRSPLSHTSAAIPGLGVLPLGGWMLELNEPWGQSGSTGGGTEGAAQGGNVEPKPPLLAQWDTTMQNTLNLNKKNLGSRRLQK